MTLTRPLALLAYAALCEVEADHDYRSERRRKWLRAQAMLAQADAERLGATEQDGLRLREWMEGA